MASTKRLQQQDLALLDLALGVAPAAEDLADFAACERLLLGLYRMGENGRGLDEFEHFADDMILEMERDGRLVVQLNGRAEVVEWYERALGLLAKHPRVHLCTNLVWSRQSPTEVRCNHLLTYYDFDPANRGMPLVPSLVDDCQQTFRKEGDRWVLARRFYRILHITLRTPGLHDEEGS